LGFAIVGLTSWGLYRLLRFPAKVTEEFSVEFERNRSKFLTIARKIADHQVSGTVTAPTYFEISADRNPDSLKVHDDKDPAHLVIRRAKDTERLILAWRETNGQWVIKIIMRHDGHGGHWSLVYSSPPSQTGEKLRDGDQVTQIDPNWRCVYDPTD